MIIKTKLHKSTRKVRPSCKDRISLEPIAIIKIGRYKNNNKIQTKISDTFVIRKGVKIDTKTKKINKTIRPSTETPDYLK